MKQKNNILKLLLINIINMTIPSFAMNIEHKEKLYMETLLMSPTQKKNSELLVNKIKKIMEKYRTFIEESLKKEEVKEYFDKINSEKKLNAKYQQITKQNQYYDNIHIEYVEALIEYFTNYDLDVVRDCFQYAPENQSYIIWERYIKFIEDYEKKVSKIGDILIKITYKQQQYEFQDSFPILEIIKSNNEAVKIQGAVMINEYKYRDDPYCIQLIQIIEELFTKIQKMQVLYNANARPYLLREIKYMALEKTKLELYMMQYNNPESTTEEQQLKTFLKTQSEQHTKLVEKLNNLLND